MYSFSKHRVNLEQSLLFGTQQDSNFTTALELAVRFGKTLVIQEIDGVEPILYPLLRGDLIAQGAHFWSKQIGKAV